jgi:hypothetical protein
MGTIQLTPVPEYESYVSRTGDTFPYVKEISKPHGAIDDIISWSKAELIDEWRWQLVEVSSDQRPGRYRFYFDSDRDCCAFLLKWA